MPELDYAGLVNGLEATLKGDVRLRDVHVTQELDLPTEFPWVTVRLARVSRRPYLIVAGIAAGQPDDLTVTLAVKAWHMSVQSAADARRQRDVLVSTLVDVLRSYYTIGDRVDWNQVVSIEFEPEASSENSPGIYACAVLTLEARVLT